MKKILIFASFAPSLLLFRAHLIQSLLDEGNLVSVLAPTVTLTPAFQCQFKSRFPTVKVLSIDLSLHGLNPVRDLKVIFALRALFKKESPDVIFSYTIKPVIYGSMAAHFAKVPRILSMITGLGTSFAVNTFKDHFIHQVVKFLYRRALKKCDQVIFQNPDDRALFSDLGLISLQKSILVNGSGVDLTEFSPAPLPVCVSFIFIGRLIHEKGIVEFLQAAQDIQKKYPQTHFYIVGGTIPNHPRSLTEADLQSFKRLPHFHFTGDVAEVRPYIAKSSVIVLPSYREGTPRAVLEAMAMARPVITTDAPGCRETVEHGVNGFLVPIKNRDVLVEKMEYFIQNPARCPEMGEASRKWAEARFNVHNVNKTLIRTIKEDACAQ